MFKTKLEEMQYKIKMLRKIKWYKDNYVKYILGWSDT